MEKFGRKTQNAASSVQTNKREPKLFIAKSALRVIQDEALFWKTKELECGGSLIGFKLKSNIYIPYAIDTGNDAKQFHGSITTDCKYQNGIMNKIVGYYDETDLLQYMGDYHLHPMYFPNLSHTDINTAKKILLDPIHENLDSRLTIILATFNSQDIEWCPFVVSLNGNEMDRSLKIENIKMMSVDDHRFNKFLKKPYKNITYFSDDYGYTIREQDRDSYSDLLFSINIIERLSAEREELEGKWLTSIQEYQTPEGNLFWELRLFSTELSIIFPKEYPVNPPTILYKNSESQEEEIFKHGFYDWNSLYRVSDLIENFVERFPVFEKQPKMIESKKIDIIT